MAPPTVRRIVGISDDATSGGSDYDALSAGAIADADYFVPATTATLEKNAEYIERNDEMRGQRAGNVPLSFKQSPSLTFSSRVYPSLAKKLVRKCFGVTDSVVGAASPYIHTLLPSGSGVSVLPAVNAQLVRDEVSHKISGGYVSSLAFEFPADGDGTLNAEIRGLYQKTDPAAAPTVTGLPTESPLMLRDARVWVNPTSEAQTITAVSSPSAGTFTLTLVVDGQSFTTAAIAYNASAATIITALNLHPNVSPGDIVGSGGALPGTPVVLTFAQNLAGRDIAQITADSTGVTGGSYSVTTGTAGTSIMDRLEGFRFSYNQNPSPHWYAGQNVVTRTDIGTPALTRKLWFPSEHRLTGMPEVRVGVNFGQADATKELGFDFSEVQKIVFECQGDAISGGYETLRITCYAVTFTEGGIDSATARDDLSSSYDGGAFYSPANSGDVKVEVLDATAAAIT